MAEHTRQLVEATKIVADAAASLSTHVSHLLEKVRESLPDEEPPVPLTAEVGEDVTDATRMTALLEWDNSGTGNHVTIDWGVTDVVDDDEPATGTKSYQYATAGTYAIDVTDLEDATRTVTVDVTVPFTVTGA